MKKIIWYEISTGKVISSISTLEGTEEVTRPAFDNDNNPKTLAYAEVSIDDSKTHLAVYNAETEEIIYNEETNLITLSIQLRKIRNNRLKDCDWTQAIDSPLSAEKKAEWATYRQALRDLPSSYTDSDTFEDVIFPVKPE